MAEAWVPDLATAVGAKYQAIADALSGAITRSELRTGDRLPPQRELAARLGVDLTTVTKAYDLVRRRGLIEARGRAGSFVAEPGGAPAEVTDASLVDTGMNMPPEISGGLLAHTMSRTITALLGVGTARLQYQPSGGAPQDRAAGARLLRGVGLESSEEQVVVTAGGQNALHAILGPGLEPGAVVACGRFVYPGFRALAARLGLRLLALPEMRAEALAEACRSARVKALYVVPTNDNPTAETLPTEERAAIAAVAEREGLTIVEDDAYGLLAGGSIPPIAAFAPERSWHIASLSKLLSPGLRVAYVRAPSVGGALRLAADVHETAIMAPPLNVAMATAWLADGSFDRLVAAMRREVAERQALAEAALGGVDYRRHPRGYHLWLPLPPGLAAAELVHAMQPEGLSLTAADRFAVTPGAEQAVRVSLGGPIARERLGRALRVLHGYLTAPAARAAPIV
ncbi:PLP-dependent aminotransferase family protein [Sphingomonas sp.]|uniref:aminotransferase-like domain-containing protein n=1 Tax=Sphingomonas sp. TaxID=28214 RepID=UPI001B25247B|nr:PLP-dependent aminotransferase family protein [Sphingomonas sp.]MBO9714364.1 PLP-dependent aminotransferase family protein [Sphingomonas sp.]